MTTQGYGLDSFLDYSSKGSKSGGYFGNWKSNIDEDHGEITILMHTKMMPTPFWSHPFRAVVESKREGDEGKLIVVGRRFTCHEPDAIAKLQKYRLDDGTAEHRPTICPNCILTSVVASMVAKGQLGFTDIVFEWKGTDDDSLVQVRAGGIYGAYKKKTGLTREQQVAMRKASISQKDAFKHDMRNQLKFAFVVVNLDKIEDGLLIDTESEGLANRLRKAIVAEGEKIQTMKRKDMRDESIRPFWDPALRPYPFKWKYDNTKDFEEKFTVVALNGADVPEEARTLVVDADLPAIDDLSPGNCYDLRAELEAHCKVKLPWDEIFGPAKDAGLMVPPQESKEEVHDEDQGRTPEISSQSKDESIRVGPEHVAWKNKAFKPGPEFKGRDVFVLPPEGLPDAEIDRVIALFKTVATSVGEIVACEHCTGEMTTFDPSCPTCGAQVDDDGKLITRPCVNPICETQVHLVEQKDKESDLWICPSCATIQRVDENGQWVEVKREEPAKAASPRQRRRGAA